MFGTISIIGLVALGLFFLLREVMLWYWRVNTILDEQKETNRLLRKLIDTIATPNTDVIDVKQTLQAGSALVYFSQNIDSENEMFARLEGDIIPDIPYLSLGESVIKNGMIHSLRPGSYNIKFFLKKNGKENLISQFQFDIKSGEKWSINATYGQSKLS